MKIPLVIRTLSCMLGLLTLGASCAYAQSEIDPDHFDSPNTEPFRQPKPKGDGQVAETKYERRFELPYSVLCGGKKLAPGKYTLSLRSDGKVARAILDLMGQAIEIAGVVQSQARKPMNSALIVEGKGEIRTLSAIQVTEFDFIFGPNHQTDSSQKRKPALFERLPITLSAPKRRHGAAG